MDSGIKKERYLIEGMTCSGCERAVQKAITNLPGIKSAKAELASGSVAVEYDPSEVTIDMIKSAVSKLGYKIVGEQPAHEQQEKKG